MQAGASATELRACSYGATSDYRSCFGPVSVREIQWEEVSPEVSAMATGRRGPKSPPLTGSYPELLDLLICPSSTASVLAVTEQDREAVQGCLATLGPPNQLLQLAVCCNQASMEASARPASKAAAKRVWVPGDKQNKLKEAEAATASASASAETGAKETEKKATDTVSDESRRLWADEPVDPCYMREDINLGTLTPEQRPRRSERSTLKLR